MFSVTVKSSRAATEAEISSGVIGGEEAAAGGCGSGCGCH